MTSAFRALMQAARKKLAVGLVVETGVAIGFTQKCYGLLRANG